MGLDSHVRFARPARLDAQPCYLRRRAAPQRAGVYPPPTPCSVFDSRSGSPLPGGEITNVTITGVCGVPGNAVAAALNFTIIGPVGPGHLIVFPANGQYRRPRSLTSSLARTCPTRRTSSLARAGPSPLQSVTTTNLVIDVYGYFTDVEELAGANTALGFNALASNIFGSGRNIFGDANTALGANALMSNTTGRSNTATGNSALRLNTTGRATPRAQQHRTRPSRPRATTTPPSGSRPGPM